VLVATKVGYRINPLAKTLDGAGTDPARIAASLLGSRRRLKRERIDLVLFAPQQPFASGSRADFRRACAPIRRRPDRRLWLEHRVPRERGGFRRAARLRGDRACDERIFPRQRLLPAIQGKGLLSLVRSSLATGLLGGKYDAARC
jgi:aryl-alcohol dehydrogenase-like predicted oxidoreductase